MKSNNEVDLSRFISLNIKTLKWLGFWFFIPHPYCSVRFFWSILVRVVLGAFVFVFSTGGQAAYVAKLLLSGNASIQEVAGVINLVLTELLASTKLLHLWTRRKQLMLLVDRLVNQQSHYYVSPHNAILEKAVQHARWLFKVFMVTCLIDITVHSVVLPALQHFTVLPLKMDLLVVDIREEPYFKYACAYQVLYKPIVVIMYICVQSFPWSAMLHAISQLDVLSHNLKHMGKIMNDVRLERNCNRDEAFKEVFTKFVAHHQDIASFVKLIESTFGGQLSLALVLTIAILCTTGVQALSISSPLKNLAEVGFLSLYMCVFILMLFVDCYFGNTITVKSKYVATLIFECPWLHLSLEHKRNLAMFIARTQRPLVITASKLVPVSLETFTKVMNWTYKGFAVMNQMKH